MLFAIVTCGIQKRLVLRNNPSSFPGHSRPSLRLLVRLPDQGGSDPNHIDFPVSGSDTEVEDSDGSEATWTFRPEEEAVFLEVTAGPGGSFSRLAGSACANCHAFLSIGDHVVEWVSGHRNAMKIVLHSRCLSAYANEHGCCEKAAQLLVESQTSSPAHLHWRITTLVNKLMDAQTAGAIASSAEAATFPNASVLPVDDSQGDLIE